MDKIVPHLFDFKLMPASLPHDGKVYLILYRGITGRLRLDQRMLGAFPDLAQPLFYHPTPVRQMVLTPGGLDEIRRLLPAWEAALKGAVA